MASNPSSSGDQVRASEHHIGGIHYVLTYVGLVILTVATFLASRVLPAPWEEIVALLIAAAKAAMIVLVFMHMLEQRFANRFVLTVALLYILILILLVMVDVTTRPEIEVIQPIIGERVH